MNNNQFLKEAIALDETWWFVDLGCYLYLLPSTRVGIRNIGNYLVTLATCVTFLQARGIVCLIRVPFSIYAVFFFFLRKSSGPRMGHEGAMSQRINRCSTRQNWLIG